MARLPGSEAAHFALCPAQALLDTNAFIAADRQGCAQHGCSRRRWRSELTARPLCVSALDHSLLILLEPVLRFSGVEQVQLSIELCQ